MEPELHVLLQGQAVLLQLFGRNLPVEILDADREVVDDARRTLMPKRHVVYSCAVEAARLLRFTDPARICVIGGGRGIRSHPLTFYQ